MFNINSLTSKKTSNIKFTLTLFPLFGPLPQKTIDDSCGFRARKCIKNDNFNVHHKFVLRLQNRLISVIAFVCSHHLKSSLMQ